MDLWDLLSDEEPYDPDERIVSPLARHTPIGWRHLLGLSQRRVPVGYGPLDSFLSGPDLDRRIELVEHEASTDAWFRDELRDTLGLSQPDWTPDQLARLKQAAGLPTR